MTATPDTAVVEGGRVSKLTDYLEAQKRADQLRSRSLSWTGSQDGTTWRASFSKDGDLSMSGLIPYELVASFRTWLIDVTTDSRL